MQQLNAGSTRARSAFKVVDTGQLALLVCFLQLTSKNTPLALMVGTFGTLVHLLLCK